VTVISAPPDQADVVRRLRETYASGLTRPIAWRRDQLRAMVAMHVECEAELLEALAADLGKPAFEGWESEIALSVSELEESIKNLDGWSRAERVPTPLSQRPGKSYVVREPLGVALVIAPWNYPLQLLLLPMAAAIAAGNAVVGKPSELAPATAAAVARLLPRYLDPAAVAVVQGGVPETTDLLAQRFDHIFYTGNGRVGRVVLRAAAEHLTPVTLELGGKSPAIVAADADLAVAARRIAWGKFFNAGQTCVAPDHVLVHGAIHTRFVAELAKAVRQFYGRDPRQSADYARIVNDQHFARVTGLLDAGGYERVVTGGERDAASRYLAPTVVDGVKPDAALMGEEIFGPVLPVLPVDDITAAVAHVNAGDKPLALYAFTGDQETVDHILRDTSSGGVLINHTLLQLSVPGLPFGGVGQSGMGAYHGRWGFETFSHRRAVLHKPAKPDLPVQYPPYTGWKQKVLRKVL